MVICVKLKDHILAIIGKVKIIVKFIKNLFGKNKLSFINEKDILWAKRYKTDEEKSLFPKGHQEGPFIVINKRKKDIYIVMCSSKKNNNVPELFRYKLYKDIYNIKKDTYACCDCIYKLDKSQFIKKMDIISNDDFNNIYKYLYLINKKYKKIELYNKLNNSFAYSIGDIVLYDNSLFYIYDKTNEYLYTYNVTVSKKGKFILNNNGTFYSFNFYVDKKIKIGSLMKLIDVFSKDFQNIIRNEASKTKKEINEKNKLNRGKLVTIHNDYYYIYGEFQDKLLVYRVYLDKEYINGVHKIVINKETYYTLFEEDEIIRSSDITIKSVARDKEMNWIKNMKKNYLYKKKKLLKKNREKR